MFVKPHEGYTVRDPITRNPLPPDGAEVPETVYWLQRLRDGDVVAAGAEAEVEAPEAPPVTTQQSG
jgi:hypothetical protein